MSGRDEYDDETPPAPKAAAIAPPPEEVIHALEKRLQWLAVGLGVETLLLVLLAVGGLLWYSQVQKERRTEASQHAEKVEREVTTALNEAHDLAEQGRSQADRPQQWQTTLTAAEEAAKRADAVFKVGDGTDELKQKVLGVRAELDQSKKALDLSNQLDALRLRRPEGKDQATEIANEYARTFREFGINMRILDAGLSAKKLQPLPNRDAALDGVLDWADITPDAAERRKLLEVVVVTDAADTDPHSILKQVARAVAANKRADLVALAKGLDLQGQPPRSVRRLGDALDQLGAPTEAADILRRGQERFPQDFWLNYTLGALLGRGHGAKDRTDSLRFLTTAAALRTPTAAVYNHLGLALRVNGEIDEAIRAYQKALSYDSRNVAVQNNLGTAQLLKGDVEGALASFRTALDIEPKRVETLINLGAALQAKGDLPAAVRAFNDALEIDKKSATALTNLGLVLDAQYDLDGAAAAHKKALAIEPKSVAAHNNLGNTQLAKGDVDEALETFRAALEIDPGFPATYLNLGAALRNKGDFDGALRSFQSAAELAPRDNLPHEHLGFVLGLKGDLAGAIREYRTALELNPRSATAYLDLAKDLVEKGQLDEAIKVLDAGLKPTAVPEKHQLRPPLHKQKAEYQSWEQLDNEKPDNNKLIYRFPLILTGELRFNGPEEQIAVARLCQFLKHQFNNAAVFYAEAFNLRPEVANDLRLGYRFDAACAAALAGAGQGEDVASFQELDRQRQRTQARHWLQDDLGLWTKLAASDKGVDRALARAAMLRWKQERAFAGVRGKDALQKLNEGERVAWQKFWDDVDGLVKQLRQQK